MKHESRLILETETDYPKLRNDNGKDGKMYNTIVLNMERDYDIIQYLLNFANISVPSELKNKYIPIKPFEKRKYSNGPYYYIDYEIHRPKKTISSKIKYYCYRSGAKLRLYKRTYSNNIMGSSEKITLNKNIFLLLSILSYITTLIINTTSTDLFGGYIIGLFLGTYIGLILIGCLYGIYEILFYEKENRNYIKYILN